MSTSSWCRRLVAVAVAVAACAPAACGGDDGQRRVARYIENANTIQQRAAPGFRAANAAYTRFATGELGPRDADLELTAAETSIRAARDRLAELAPPADAARLHALLLRVYDGTAAFAAETTLLARYLPAARNVLAPLPAKGRELQRRLARADTPAAQTAALDAYAGEVRAQQRRLRRLSPPPVLVESHRRQLVRLFDIGRLADRLGAAVAGRDPRLVGRLLSRFRAATGQRAPQTLTRAAVQAYNERYRMITRSVAAMQREQVRLRRESA